MEITEMLKALNDVRKVEILGGRESMFGLAGIFETILREKHESITEEELKNNYPFRSFRGMFCYGNMIEQKYTEEAIDFCNKKLKFTREEWERLLNYYLTFKPTPDSVVLYCFLKTKLNGVETTRVNAV